MWIFLVTEVMFFGTLFLGLAAYRYLYGEAFEKASEKLNWMVGGINTAPAVSGPPQMITAAPAQPAASDSTLIIVLSTVAGVALIGGAAFYLRKRTAA